MKKLVLLCCLMVICPWLFAQESSLRFSVGYGLPAGPRMITENYSAVSSPTVYSSNTKGIYGSFGAGLNFGASYVHMYSPSIGLDVSLQYLSGKKYEGYYSYRSTDSNGNTLGSSTQNSTYSSSGMLFSPSLIIGMGGSKVKPYAKFGLVLGIVKIKSDDTESGSGSSTITSESKEEFSGGLSWGTKAAFGLDFNAAKNVNFFTELTFTSMTYFPQKLTETLHVVNGVSQPLHNTTFTRETNESSTNPNASNESIGDHLPFGSIALSIGMRIRI